MNQPLKSIFSAKRKTLEDPELYRTRSHSKTEERLRRKMIRNMIMDMPGKLDHASVVAYKVGAWHDDSSPAEASGREEEEAAEPIQAECRLNAEERAGLPETGPTAENIKEVVAAESFSFRHPSSTSAGPSTSEAVTTLAEKLVLERRYLRLDIRPAESRNSPTTATVHFSPEQTRRSPYEGPAVSN